MTLCVSLLIASEFLPVSLLTPIAADLHATEGMAGQAISISGLFAVVTSLFIAAIAGRFDRRHVLVVLTALMLTSLVLIAEARNFAMLMAARAVKLGSVPHIYTFAFHPSGHHGLRFGRPNTWPWQPSWVTRTLPSSSTAVDPRPNFSYESVFAFVAGHRHRWQRSLLQGGNIIGMRRKRSSVSEKLRPNEKRRDWAIFSVFAWGHVRNSGGPFTHHTNRFCSFSLVQGRMSTSHGPFIGMRAT
jgi:MFS family permease